MVSEVMRLKKVIDFSYKNNMVDDTIIIEDDVEVYRIIFYLLSIISP